ncbi:hypothetical protein H0G86_010157 [Trichoderma simmonsii]|uniref:Uncharacterized protein n=1 Tax=Trichoderma simmonsii TaxID=1491479 RepID=A0A8G0PJS4_9HYPO|nr:hypothetical protein H0G86_010157 [Trichoderma simmonsii]
MSQPPMTGYSGRKQKRQLWGLVRIGLLFLRSVFADQSSPSIRLISPAQRRTIIRPRFRQRATPRSWQLGCKMGGHMVQSWRKKATKWLRSVFLFIAALGFWGKSLAWG